MIRKYEMGALADLKILRINLHAFCHQLGHLFPKCQWIEHHAGADYAKFSFAKNPRRNQPEKECFVPANNLMTCIVPPLRPDTNVDLVGQVINYLSFAFITPLGAE